MQKVNGVRISHLTAVLGHAVLLGLSPVNAFAYIDPGSGSLLLQMIMSAALGTLFLARNFIAKGAAAVRRWFGGRAETPPVPPDEPGS